MSQKPGIVSPWTGLEETSPPVDTPSYKREILSEEAEKQVNSPITFGDVVLKGRGFSIHTSVPQPNSTVSPNAQLGWVVLGACLKNLLSSFKRFELDLKKQSIFLQPPLGPNTVFKFEHIVLYAKASSLDLKVAQAMAIDRLALSILETVGWEERAANTLAQYRVEIVRNG